MKIYWDKHHDMSDLGVVDNVVHQRAKNIADILKKYMNASQFSVEELTLV